MKWRAVSTLLLVVIAAIPSLTSGSSVAAAISQAYHPQGSIPSGSLVSLVQGRSDSVTTADTSNDSRLVGIAVATSASLLAVNPSADTVQVAAAGTAPVMVSTYNDDIRTGDVVSVSPLSGIGMKAEPGLPTVGVAEAGFSAGSSGATERTVGGPAGKTLQVAIGYVSIRVGLGGGSNGSASLNGLQRLVVNLTGHTISTARILASLVVAIMALASLVTLTYASIYASIIGIGRNPLAKYAVLRNLRLVLVVALLAAAVTSGTIILLLR
jgi:hypothetical protein